MAGVSGGPVVSVGGGQLAGPDPTLPATMGRQGGCYTTAILQSVLGRAVGSGGVW